MQKKWQLAEPEPLLTRQLSSELGVSPLTAQLLINRGLRDAAAAESFVRPRLGHLRDPQEIPHSVTAARRVLLARERGEKVLVFGDYDVDGVTGTAILVHTLAHLGIQAEHYIPHRYEEGYSLSVDAVRQIAGSGVKLIVTVDCGTASREEIALANELGLEVIVTDHHNLPASLPPALAVVNPKMLAADHPSRDLAGAGVAFKFAWTLLRQAGIKESAFLTSLLDLAALGTISDVVPLTRENRVLAVQGLALLNQRQRIGLKKLAEAAGVPGRLTVHHVYYALAPRINAAGRLEHASRSLELMLTADPARAAELAAELNRINVRRQGIGLEIKDQAFARIEQQLPADNRLLLLQGKEWHPGVIGIVASQLVDRFRRPAVLVGVYDGVGRGSARSLAGINIYRILESCQDLFIDFGGHAGAAGFEINASAIDELFSRLEARARETLSLEDLAPRLTLDAELDPASITLGLVQELALLDPYGEGNPQPLFFSRRLKVADHRLVGKQGRHLKLRLTSGTGELEAIGFDLGSLAGRLEPGREYDAAYCLETNEWGGFERVQLRLADLRPSAVGETMEVIK